MVEAESTFTGMEDNVSKEEEKLRRAKAIEEGIAAKLEAAKLEREFQKQQRAIQFGGQLEEIEYQKKLEQARQPSATSKFIKAVTPSFLLSDEELKKRFGVEQANLEIEKRKQEAEFQRAKIEAQRAATSGIISKAQTERAKTLADIERQKAIYGLSSGYSGYSGPASSFSTLSAQGQGAGLSRNFEAWKPTGGGVGALAWKKTMPRIQQAQQQPVYVQQAPMSGQTMYPENASNFWGNKQVVKNRFIHGGVGDRFKEYSGFAQGQAPGIMTTEVDMGQKLDNLMVPPDTAQNFGVINRGYSQLQGQPSFMRQQVLGVQPGFSEMKASLNTRPMMGMQGGGLMSSAQAGLQNAKSSLLNSFKLGGGLARFFSGRKQ